MLKKISLLSLLLVGFTANHPDNGSKSADDKEYLFVIMSSHGEIRKATKKGSYSYELVLERADVQKIVAFSDRPTRVVRHESAKDFEFTWREGKTSFEKDPPNAAVIINQHLQTVVLVDMRFEGQKAVFRLRQDGPQPISVVAGPTQIFIDSRYCGLWVSNNSCT